MGWIRKRSDKGTYEASYRDPAGRVRSKSFKTKGEARGFLAAAENAKQRGDWTDPRGGKIRFEDYAADYFASVAHLRPGTRQKIEGHLRNQIYPFFDKTPLGAIKPAHVRSWIAALEQIRDPVELGIELERLRVHYNTVRLHAGIGYVTPDDEHCGRAEAIRKARREGLLRARSERVAYHREQAGKGEGPFGWVFRNEFGSKSQKHLTRRRAPIGF